MIAKWLNSLSRSTLWTLASVIGLAWFSLCLWFVFGALERGGEKAVYVLFFIAFSCSMAITTLLAGTRR